MTCGTCKFWKKNDGGKDNQGQCRFNPPQVVVVTGQRVEPKMVSGVIQGVSQMVNEMRSVFPPIIADNPGCSKHEETDDA